MKPWYRHLAAIAVASSMGLAGCGGQSEQELLASAKQHLATTQTSSAVIELKTILQQNPSSAEARYLLGKALLAVGDATSASVELSKALDLKFSRTAAVPEHARALLGSRKQKQLLETYASQTLESPTAEADLRTSVATAYLIQGDLAAAKAQVAAGLKTDAKFAPALMLDARIRASTRDYQGAMAVVEGILSRDASNAEAWHFKGDLQLVGVGDQARAIESYRRSYAVKPDYLPGRVAAITHLVQRKDMAAAKAELDALKRLAPQHMATRFLEAQFVFMDKNYAKARELTEQLMKSASDDPRLLQLAGGIELEVGSLLRAETLLEKAIVRAPESDGVRRLLAQTYLRTGRPAKALAVLRSLLDASDVDGDVYALAAEAYLQTSDLGQAEAFFKRAAKASPDNAKFKTALALTDVAKGSAERGLSQLEVIAASDKEATADLAMISVRLRRGELDNALKAIDSLERKQPNQPLAANLRGRVHLLRNDRDAARKSFERALSINPAYFPAVVSLAGLDVAENKSEAAVSRFESLLKTDGKNAQALLAVAGLRARAGASKDEVLKRIEDAVRAAPAEPSPRITLVDNLLSYRQFKPALSAAQDAVAALGETPELLETLGRAQFAVGDFNRALVTYTKLSGLLPGSASAHLRVAETQRALLNDDAAARGFRRALEIDPNLVGAQKGLIGLALRARRPDDAIAVARAVQRQSPKEAAGFLLEGDIHAERHAWHEAIAAYRTGLQKVKSANRIAIKLHAVLGAAGRKDTAAEFAASWLKDYPGDTGFRFYLADLSMAKGEFAAAETRYREVIALDPRNSFAYNNVAWLMVRQGKKGAVPMAEKAVLLNPDKPALMDTLAIALQAEGQLAKAVEIEEKAVALGPELNDLRLNLAKLYLKAGKADSARVEVERLAKLGAKFGRQAEVALLTKRLAAR